jgi:diguanylate cyclase (GGDEF)-like protein
MILIVDDQPTNLQVLLHFLKQHHFEIHIAENGQRALDILVDHHPDLILLDVMMPDMDGFETCRRIKANARTADIPVIFITALTSTESKVTGFEAGGVDYITKPFHQPEVLARINTHITLQKQKKELENAKQELLKQKKLLEIMTITDDLTGLFNRRYLTNVLEREFQRSMRHDTDLSCLMFDLDHFKDVNDTHGHDLGDNVLHYFGKILSKSIRHSDFAFRIGGEEFLILLPQTSIKGAVKTGEKIRSATQAEIVEQTSIPITVSVGISSFLEHHPQKRDDLIIFADKALYAAKENGRNNVMIYSKIKN